MQPPHVEPPRGKPAFPWGIVIAALAFVFMIGGFLAIWQFLEPADRRVQVTYSSFLDDVHSGRVSTVHIHNRDIDYTLRDQKNLTLAQRHTVGPLPDQAFLDTLKPTDPNALAPNIVFEK